MNTFLETYDHPRLYEKEAETLSRMITTSKIEAVTKNFSAYKSPGWMTSQVNFTKHSKNN